MDTTIYLKQVELNKSNFILAILSLQSPLNHFPSSISLSFCYVKESLSTANISPNETLL